METIRFCPLCEQTFDTVFEPSHYGVTHRNDACCLNSSCRSLERHRLLWLYMLRETNSLLSDNTILEIGPTRAFKNAIEKHGNLKYIGLDLYSKRADIKADLKSLPFQDNSIETIICYHVLEHVQELPSSIKEIRRILSPKGTAYFQVPINTGSSHTVQLDTFSPEDRELVYGHKDHLRVFGQDFEDVLSAIGFNTKRINYVEKINSEDRLLMGLKDLYLTGSKDTPYLTSEDLFIATKD